MDWVHLIAFVISVDLMQCQITIIHPDRIVTLCETVCVILSPENTIATKETTIYVQHLADVSFREETSVLFGNFPQEVNLDKFWSNSYPLKVQGGLTPDWEAFKQSLFIFKRLKKDRECLLVPVNKRTEPEVIQIEIGVNTDTSDFLRNPKANAIINEINENCNTFRKIDGSLDIKGLHRNEIIHNLFSVSPTGDGFCPGPSSDFLIPYKKSVNQICSAQIFDSENSYFEDSQECERIPVPSASRFFYDFLSMSRPVIITGATNEWAASHKWTKTFLKDMYGKTRVHIKLSPDGQYEGVEEKALWETHGIFHIPKQVEKQLPYPDLVVVRPATLELRFSEFLDLIENISKGFQRYNMSAYLEYSSIADYFPKLEKDLSPMSFINMLDLSNLNIWLSDGNTLGKLHFDPFDNLLCQISGEKHLTLYEPHQNENLYEGHILEAQFTFNTTTGEFHRNKLLESTSMVMSPIDLKEPDHRRFPLFAKARPLKCSIKPGEILFLPAFWWHEVKSTPNITEHRNLAVNYWYEPFLKKEFPCPECKLDVNPRYHHLL